MKLPRTRYSQEFREQSVRFFKESELPLAEAAKRLSLPKGTLKNWVYADRQGELVTVGKHQRPLTELELELSRVNLTPFENSEPKRTFPYRWTSDPVVDF